MGTHLSENILLQVFGDLANEWENNSTRWLAVIHVCRDWQVRNERCESAGLFKS
jgi:hypothetical protein